MACEFQESLKEKLFESVLDEAKQKFIRESLSRVRALRQRLSSEKHCLDYLTIEGYCSLIKNQYLVSKTLFCGKSSNVFP